MIPLPESNYSESEVLASWLELSALTKEGGSAARGAVAESLRDSHLFSASHDDVAISADQSIATDNEELVERIWLVLKSRQHALDSAWPFVLSDDRLDRAPGKESLSSVAAYAAMLLVEAASLKWYGSIAIRQGDKVRTWFEYIATLAIGQLVRGKTIRFGAPFPSGWPTKFPDQVRQLAREFGVRDRIQDIENHASSLQKDDSLDIVARWRLADEEPSSPFIFVQCATGADWEDGKRAEPLMELWRRYVSWNGPTYKALAVPFGLRGKNYLSDASVRHGDAIVFDRLRLAAGRPDDFVAPQLRSDLTKWCRKKLSLLASST